METKQTKGETVITIRWKVSYLQEVDYEVCGDGAPYRVSLRWAADPYFRSIFNGTEDQWQRGIVRSVGVLHTDRNEMVKPEVLAVFRQGDHYHADVPIRTGYFNHDPNNKGWTVMEEPYEYDPTASHDSFDRFYRCYMDPAEGWCCVPREPNTVPWWA